MITYKTFSLITGLLIAVILIKLARKSKIHTTHFIWWSSIISFILIFAIFPTLIDIIGRLVGISYPPIIVAVAGLGLMLIKTLTMDIYITQNEIRYKKLAQKMALLEKMVKEQSDNIESDQS